MNKLITYPTAKLAKEKRFDEECRHCYHKFLKLDNGEPLIREFTQRKFQNSIIEDHIAAPAQSELQDWFIEKHGVAVLADLDCTLSWIWKIIPLHPEASIQEQFVSGPVYSTKQLAIEEGLLKALTELK